MEIGVLIQLLLLIGPQSYPNLRNFSHNLKVCTFLQPHPSLLLESIVSNIWVPNYCSKAERCSKLLTKEVLEYLSLRYRHCILSFATKEIIYVIKQYYLQNKYISNFDLKRSNNIRANWILSLYIYSRIGIHRNYSIFYVPVI